jgi:hypothetical protein
MEHTVGMLLPKYKCHKEVWALKIARVDIHGDNSCTITPEDKHYVAFMLSSEYNKKHKPQAGGYYVVYDDGYQSWSPAKAFEDGYSLIK